MGDEAGRHESIHVARVGAQLQIGHVGGNLGCLLYRLVGHNHGIGTGQGGIADVAELLQLHIGEHTDIHGVFHIDTGADAARHIHMVNHVHGHIHGLQKGVDGGENGALGTDEIVNIHLVDGDFTARLALGRLSQHKSAHAVGIVLHTAALPDEETLGVDDGAAVKLGNNVDNTGAADAHRSLSLVTHDGEARLHGVPVKGAGFDGTVGGTHAAGDIAALKGGAGGAGAAHQEIPVAEDDFAVGTQVDEEAHLILIPHTRGQSARRNIAAHVGADIGGNDHIGLGVGGELHIGGLHAHPAEEAGDIGLHAHALGIHAHEQVVHGGVGAHGQAQNVVGGNLGLLAEVRNNGGQGLLDDGILQFLAAAGLALLNNAVDDIRTEANLAVAGGALGKELAGLQIGEHHGDGGGADIDGAAHDCGVVGGANLHAAENIAL